MRMEARKASEGLQREKIFIGCGLCAEMRALARMWVVVWRCGRCWLPCLRSSGHFASDGEESRRLRRLFSKESKSAGGGTGGTWAVRCVGWEMCEIGDV
jgi:hypothetical protein